MANPPNIRLLKPDDLKIVQYQIGMERMGPLTVANNKAYLHPLTISLWVIFSSIMVQVMGWYPTRDGPLGTLGLLFPLPAFACTAVPFMFFFEWKHRPIFEENLEKALKAVDMLNPGSYYSRSPASGFYVLENRDKIIGLIALDASTEPSASDGRKPKSSKANVTAETAVIRHFFVEDAYRISEVQIDLLRHAVENAFLADSSPRPHRVRIVSSDLDSYKKTALKALKFHPIVNWDGQTPQEWKLGIYGWNNRWLELTREEWKAAKE